MPDYQALTQLLCFAAAVAARPLSNQQVRPNHHLRLDASIHMEKGGRYLNSYVFDSATAAAAAAVMHVISCKVELWANCNMKHLVTRSKPRR